MAKSRVVRQSAIETASRREASLGPGLHPGRVEMAVAAGAGPAGPAFQVRLANGRNLVAALAEGVSPAFVAQCMREGRTVVLVNEARGAVIAGALQTSSAAAADARGVLALEARHLRLRAEETLELEVPGSSLRLEPGGAVRIEGDRLVLDMAALVRILSARVEVP